jgi:hypothetical protein
VSGGLLRLGVLLAALLALSLALERLLAGRAPATPREERLLALRSTDEPLGIAALTVAFPGAAPFRYVRTGGVWRCSTALDAPAHAEEIAELATGLANAHGMPRPLAGAELARAALDPAAAIRVALFGSTGAELLVLDIGAPLPGPGPGRTFVRRPGDPYALEIDAAPRRLLERPQGSALPPLLDQRVLAGTPLDPRRGLRRLYLERPDGTSLELLADPASAPQPAWILLEDGEPSAAPALTLRVAAYLAFLSRVPYAGFTTQERAESMGLEGAARLTLEPQGAPAILLEISPPSTRPLLAVLNHTSRLTLLVTPAHGPLFTPAAALLNDPATPDPWESWLRP